MHEPAPVIFSFFEVLRSLKGNRLYDQLSREVS